MKLLEIRTMLWTTALHETVEYYTSVLGFTCGEFNPDWGWATLHRDNVEIMLAVPDKQTPFEKPQFTGSLYITTEEVDALWNELKDKATIFYPIDNFEHGMREFAIKDNNGYIIQFGEEV